jgi:hypothetical protein
VSRKARDCDEIAAAVHAGHGTLSSTEVGLLLRFSHTTVTRWAAEGKLVFTRHGPRGYRHYPAGQFRPVLAGGPAGWEPARLARDLGPVMVPRPRTAPDVPPRRRAAIVASCRDGASIGQAASRHRVPAAAVREILRAPP